ERTNATGRAGVLVVRVPVCVRGGVARSVHGRGENPTVSTFFEHSLPGKGLKMRKGAPPAITRVAVMQNPDHPAWEGYLRAIGTAASALGVEVTPAPVHNANEIEHVLEAFARIPNGGLILLPSGVATNHRDPIAPPAGRYR